MKELEDVLRFQQVPQSVLAQVTQLNVWWKGAPGKLPHRMRQDDLAAMSRCQQPGEPVEGSREIVTAGIGLRFASMQRHAHVQAIHHFPFLGEQRALGVERGGDGGRGGGKRGLHCVADRLEVDAAMGRDGRIQKREMALNGRRHCRPVPLPELGAALDVGEEEGDGAARQVSHWPFPSVLPRTRLVTIVARAICDYEQGDTPG